MKNLKSNRLLTTLIVGTVIFTILYFAFFKTLKEKIDRRTIYYMYRAEYSDFDLKWRIWMISNSNMNKFTDLNTVASSSVCNNNTDILELVEQKGGKFVLYDLSTAYRCEADKAIEFLEKKGFSVFDNDLQISKFLLSEAIDSGEYYDKDKQHLKTLLERNPKLKTNITLISMIKQIEINEYLPKTNALRKELLSYFSDPDQDIDSEKETQKNPEDS